MRVEPEERQPRPGHRRAEDQQLARARDVREQQVLAVDRVTHHIGKHAQATAHQHHRHDHQAVQAIGQVHGVARADDHEIGQHDEAHHAQRVADFLEEGHDQVGLVRHIGPHAALDPAQEQAPYAHVAGLGHRERQIDRRHQPDQRLPEELLAARHAARVAIHHLAVVIDPADGAVAHRHQQHHPDEAVAPVTPEQRGDADREQHQHPAHGRRARLHEVGLRADRAHGLADLQLGQATDHPRPEAEADHQRGEVGRHRAESQVVDDPQEAVIVLQPLGQSQ
ncbi:hypothetical protein D3C81_1208850 [compost metagenome]